MIASNKKLFAILIVTLVSITLVGCSSGKRKGVTTHVGNTKSVDLSGHWELNYSKSDNIQAQLNVMVRELQRQAQQRSQGRGDSRGGPAYVIGGSDTGASIMGLARMADLITQSQLMEVEQEQYKIKVKREENFALTCEFYPGQSVLEENPLGSEVCGWDDHQLVFRIILPEGLTIQHRFTLGADEQHLNIATTVYSDQVRYPFTLNRVYNRFQPTNGGVTCEITLTRGKVCTTESS